MLRNGTRVFAMLKHTDWMDAMGGCSRRRKEAKGRMLGYGTQMTPIGRIKADLSLRSCWLSLRSCFARGDAEKEEIDGCYVRVLAETRRDGGYWFCCYASLRPFDKSSGQARPGQARLRETWKWLFFKKKRTPLIFYERGSSNSIRGFYLTKISRSWIISASSSSTLSIYTPSAWLERSITWTPFDDFIRMVAVIRLPIIS